MGHWGVASPQLGRIEGQPIIDMRLEDIIARLIASEAHDSAQVESDREYVSEILRSVQDKHEEAIELAQESQTIITDWCELIVANQKDRAQTALTMHLEAMNRLKVVEELFIARTNNIENHLFEHLIASIRWWLVNIVWPYMKKPLWSKK